MNACDEDCYGSSDSFKYPQLVFHAPMTVLMTTDAVNSRLQNAPVNHVPSKLH